jgi:hypothetical protein
LNRDFAFSVLFELDLFRKPRRTFRDHALTAAISENKAFEEMALARAPAEP